MLKKFISNALLSVVMDKSARQKLDKNKSSSPPDKKTKKRIKSEKPVADKKSIKQKEKTKPSADSDEDILNTIASAVALARKEVEEGIPQRGAKAPSTRTPPHTLARTSTRENLNASNPPVRPKTTRESFVPSHEQKNLADTPSSTRQKLIANALDIQRQKAHILDDLDPAARDKLQLMAQFALAPESLPDELKKEFGIGVSNTGNEPPKVEHEDTGLVDNIGGGRKPRITRRKR